MENITGNTLEQSHSVEQKHSQSDAIFDKVYNQLRWPPTIEHANRFMDRLDNAVSENIISAEHKDSNEILNNLWRIIEANFEKFHNDSNYKPAMEYAEKLHAGMKKHIDTLVQNDFVEPIVAKAFLHNMLQLGHIGNYNAMIRNREGVSARDLGSYHREYHATVYDWWNKVPDDKKLFQGSYFRHFNSDHVGNISDRIYISASLKKNPMVVVRAWQEALEQTGLSKRLYFKLGDTVDQRTDTIVIYRHSGVTDEDMTNALSTFQRLCPNDALLDDGMATAVRLAPGVSWAPEPININTYLRFSGQESLSYSEFVGGLSELAFELAYQGAKNSSHQETTTLKVKQLTPLSLKKKARNYFEQLLRVVNINPDTMVPQALGGKLPAWTKQLQAQASQELKSV